jgi:hypothetical protein
VVVVGVISDVGISRTVVAIVQQQRMYAFNSRGWVARALFENDNQ